ncbi:hypothetical protein PC116_g11100 [Phytophthora cactorum]|uniref:Uncharacterized protein n=1 Tax=Phytophthora cactorum TaxID=29920 RepID=A0A8T1B7W8_9STRA|nr:hypothetical protein PC115_g17723 [Phytophthora cactorum]KAG4240931.1 hypothetical protein PC116_g11100 [Phytophthora cactorum]
MSPLCDAPRTRKHQCAGSLRIEARSASAANRIEADSCSACWSVLFTHKSEQTKRPLLVEQCCFCVLFVTPPVIETYIAKIDRQTDTGKPPCRRTILKGKSAYFGPPTDNFRKCTH